MVSNIIKKYTGREIDLCWFIKIISWDFIEYAIDRLMMHQNCQTIFLGI
jgi:hypothetical protein